MFGFFGLMGVFVMGKCELYHLYGEIRSRDEWVGVLKIMSMQSLARHRHFVVLHIHGGYPRWSGVILLCVVFFVLAFMSV